MSNYVVSRRKFLWWLVSVSGVVVFDKLNRLIAWAQDDPTPVAIVDLLPDARETGGEIQRFSERLNSWTEVIDAVVVENLGITTSEIIQGTSFAPMKFEGFRDESIISGAMAEATRTFWIQTLTGIGGSTLEQVPWDHVLSKEEAAAMLDDPSQEIALPIKLINDYYKLTIGHVVSLSRYAEEHPDIVTQKTVDPRKGLSLIQHASVTQDQLQSDKRWMLQIVGGFVIGVDVSETGRLELHSFYKVNNPVGGNSIPWYMGENYLYVMMEAQSMMNLSPHPNLNNINFGNQSSNFWELSRITGLGDSYSDVMDYASMNGAYYPGFVDIHL